MKTKYPFSDLPEIHTKGTTVKVLRALRTVVVSVFPIDAYPKEWEGYESDIGGIFTSLNYDEFVEGLKSLGATEPDINELLSNIRKRGKVKT